MAVLSSSPLPSQSLQVYFGLTDLSIYLLQELSEYFAYFLDDLHELRSACADCIFCGYIDDDFLFRQVCRKCLPSGFWAFITFYFCLCFLCRRFIFLLCLNGIFSVDQLRLVRKIFLCRPQKQPVFEYHKLFFQFVYFQRLKYQFIIYFFICMGKPVAQFCNCFFEFFRMFWTVCTLSHRENFIRIFLNCKFPLCCYY